MPRVYSTEGEELHWIGDQLSEDFEAWEMRSYVVSGDGPALSDLDVLVYTRNGKTWRVTLEAITDVP